MKKLQKTVLFSLIIFALNSTAFGETGNEDNGDDFMYDRDILFEDRDNFISENGDLPVKQIRIRGLEKTRGSVILNESGLKSGEKLSSFDPHRFINRLKKKNLFTDIHINYIRESDTVIIDLSLNEKWSIIPLPVFYTNGETTLYGFYILETNFMGYGKAIFAGGTYSENSKNAIFGFIDPSLFGTQFLANLFLIYKDSISQSGTADKKFYSEYSSKIRTARVDAGYSFLNGVKLFLSEGYNDNIVDSGYSNSLYPPDSRRFLLNGALLKFDFLKYYEYLYYGLKGEINCYTHIPADGGSEYNTIDYKIDYSHKFFNFHRVTLYSSGSAGDRPTVFEEKIGGDTGTRTLPADIIAADNYFNYSVVYEYPFFKFSRGAVTLLGLWEHGIYNRNNSSYADYYGPGCGVLLYLKRIALPAVGFNYAWNLKTGNSEFSINVGYTF